MSALTEDEALELRTALETLRNHYLQKAADDPANNTAHSIGESLEELFTFVDDQLRHGTPIDITRADVEHLEGGHVHTELQDYAGRLVETHGWDSDDLPLNLHALLSTFGTALVMSPHAKHDILPDAKDDFTDPRTTAATPADD